MYPGRLIFQCYQRAAAVTRSGRRIRRGKLDEDRLSFSLALFNRSMQMSNFNWSEIGQKSADCSDCPKSLIQKTFKKCVMRLRCARDAPCANKASFDLLGRPSSGKTPRESPQKVSLPRVRYCSSWTLCLLFIGSICLTETL